MGDMGKHAPGEEPESDKRWTSSLGRAWFERAVAPSSHPSSSLRLSRPYGSPGPLSPLTIPSCHGCSIATICDPETAETRLI
jgi:hypothetical protein